MTQNLLNVAKQAYLGIKKFLKNAQKEPKKAFNLLKLRNPYVDHTMFF